MISRSETKKFLNKEPQFVDIMCSLRAIAKQPKGILNETKKILAIARKFNDEIARSYTLELDLQMHIDPDYLPWDFVKKANQWGFYTLFIPKAFGGRGYSLSCIGCFLEELGSVCPALANLIGVHYLGLCGLAPALNLKLLDIISRDVAAGETKGDPRLISFAMTEPDAGTDSQNVEFMDTGSLACHAQKVKGGYVINGTKIFISCGHLSTWHALFAYTDIKRGAESMIMLMVRTGTKGFSFGKKEKKMGQKGCVASELVFKDCFVSDDYVLLDERSTKRLSRSPRKTTEQLLAYIWSLSRGQGVGPFGVGVARGAYEEALKFATETEINGSRLVDQEWCQSILAEMYTNVAIGRLAYNESVFANGMHHGMSKTLNFKPVYYFIKFTPKKILDAVAPFFTHLKISTFLARKLGFDLVGDDEIDRVDGWGSVAKLVGTDIGLKNCRMALELMGEAGVRHNRRVEKLMRDSKLLQIYEGTNQINLINIFKRFIARSCPEAVCFPYPGDDTTC